MIVIQHRFINTTRRALESGELALSIGTRAYEVYESNLEMNLRFMVDTDVVRVAERRVTNIVHSCSSSEPRRDTRLAGGSHDSACVKKPRRTQHANRLGSAVGSVQSSVLQPAHSALLCPFVSPGWLQLD